MIIPIQFYGVSNGATGIWTYNAFEGALATAAGQLSADLKDDTNTSTGYTLEIVTAFTGVSGGSTNAASGAGNFPEAVLDDYWYTNGTSSLRLGNLTNGDTYTIECAGHQGTHAARDTDFTIGGTTERYANSGTDTPNAPVSISGTASGTTLDIDLSLVDTFAYANGFYINITSAGGGGGGKNIDFTAADGTALSAYDANFVKAQGAADISALTIQSNTLQFNSWQNLVLVYTGETTEEVEVQLVNGIAQTKVGPAIRATGTNYYYAAFETDDGTNYTSLALYRNTTRIASFPDTWPIALPQNILLAGSVNGADYDLNVYVNGSGTPSIAHTDTSPLPAGEDGIVFDDASAAIAQINYFITGDGGAASNVAPVANDQTFAITTAPQNGDTVGTYTATDSDGTIASYSITGTTLAIDNAGLITIADNSGITTGTDIVATVTATDDGGATDTATITVNVNVPVPQGWSSTGAVTTLPDEANTDSIIEFAKTDATIGNYTAVVGDELVYEQVTGVTVNNDSTITVAAGTISAGQSLTFSYQFWDSTNDVMTPVSSVTVNNLGVPSSPDTTAPVITLTGNATVNVTQGQSYTDAGATASDDTDGDITANIVVGGDTVDTNTVGTYTITYNVSDAAGNAATQVTRTVNVVATGDTTPPVITLNGSSPVNVTEGQTYTDAGATATDDTDGNITGSIVVGGDTVDTNTVGTYTITYNVSDAAGNAATQVTRTVNVVAATTYSYTNTGNLVVNAQSVNVTATIPKAEIWTAAPEESGTLLDSVDNLSITDGLFTLSSNQVAPATTYLVILRSTGNTPTQYARAEVQFS